MTILENSFMWIFWHQILFYWSIDVIALGKNFSNSKWNSDGIDYKLNNSIKNVLWSSQIRYLHSEHYILLRKVRRAGLTESAVTCFQSYLSKRYQCTKLNEVMSEERRVKYGFPQGSILGPLLFIIFISDLPKHFDGSRYMLMTWPSVSRAEVQQN